jgi:succinate-semialdehyde dehydrogenase / glutarate-semialdehyde dehydrogenase
LIKTLGYIDGKWVDSKDGARITVTSKHNSWLRKRHVHEVLHLLDPANDKELGTVPEMGLAETKEAIDAASRAFKTWKNTTAKVSNVPRAAG